MHADRERAQLPHLAGSGGLAKAIPVCAQPAGLQSSQSEFALMTPLHQQVGPPACSCPAIEAGLPRRGTVHILTGNHWRPHAHLAGG